MVHGPGAPYDGAQYRDTRTGTLEEKLPEVFRSLEINRLRAEWAEQEHRRKKEERRHAWETAVASSKEQYAEHARWEHFTEKSRTWASINQHRSFLGAARKAAESYAGTNRDDVLQQLDDAERTLEAIDPVRWLSLLVLKVPDPGPEDLKPFLGRWSPYGPDGGLGL